MAGSDIQVSQPIVKRQRCEVYSRVVGYLRPVDQWNIGKKREFHDRRNFVISGGVADADK